MLVPEFIPRTVNSRGFVAVPLALTMVIVRESGKWGVVAESRERA